MRLILASGSPRRAELLRAAGYAFEVVVPVVDESVRSGEAAAAYVRRLAAEKSGAVMDVVKADHINIESLGNVVPHLHWHIVPRYQGDARWGSPIWTSSLGDMVDTRLPGEERNSLLRELRAALA